MTTETTTEQPLTFTIAEGTIAISPKDIAPAVQVLINTVQERRATINNLQSIVTSLTESNGIDTSIIIRSVKEYAQQNPTAFTPHPKSEVVEETVTE